MGTVPDIRPDWDKPNYDAEKIAPYTLEDPLVFLDGRRVTTPAEWEARRREILGIFAHEMFGVEPPQPPEFVVEKFEECDHALGGYAVRSQYRMWFRNDRSGPEIDWLLLRPRHAKKPVPVIIFLNFHGNHQLIPDPEVLIPPMWSGVDAGCTVPSARGTMDDPNGKQAFPIGTILSAGYAVLSACYCQVSPDPGHKTPEDRERQKSFAYTGVFELWGKRDPERTDDVTSLGAWAWALSRGLDLAYTIPELDAARNVVTGCSRLAKAALLAAARDGRFSTCVAVQCGGGGATLAKRDFGENIGTEMRMFPHWYCKAYGKYARNPAKLLTFDQHLLLAALAPRKLLVGGFGNPWFDTEGEFLACRAASPAWELFGLPGLPKVESPEPYDTSAVGKYLGYYRRTEEHGIAAYDWWRLLNFAGAEN